MTLGQGVDPDALLVALVLVPACLSRNRYPALYEQLPSRLARRRAAAIRGIGRQLLSGIGGATAVVDRISLEAAERTRIEYRFPRLGLRRIALLRPVELAALRWVIGRSISGGHARGASSRVASGIERVLGDSRGTRASVRGALARLSPLGEGVPRADGALAPGQHPQ